MQVNVNWNFLKKVKITQRRRLLARAGGLQAFWRSGGKIWGSRIVILAVAKNLGFCCKLPVRHVAKEFIMK